MIKNIPKIYDRESVYSYLSRIYSHSGYINHTEFCRLIFNRPSEYMDYNFINSLKDDFKEELSKYISFKDLLLDHTLLKYYIRYLDKERRIKAYKYALGNKPDLFRFLSIPLKKKDYYLRYCPVCVKEDREKYGECFFHIEHMIPIVKVCSKHCCKLVNTDILNSKERDSTFVPLELIVNEVEPVIYDENNIDVIISKKSEEVLFNDLHIYSNEKISYILLNKLDDKYKKGSKLNIELMNNDINNYYCGTEYKISKERISYIFRNLGWNIVNISLIDLFLDRK